MNKKDFLQMVETTEKTQLGVDFDGVIHKNSKGFHLVIYTCKANPNRPLVNGKTGIELVWEWLEKHNIKQNVKDVTYIKPNAIAYIDDKAIRFDNWKNIKKRIENE